MGRAVFPAKGAALCRRVWGWLARTEVVAALFLAVLIFVALGSCFPQISEPITAQNDQLAQWEALVRARYGPAAVSLLNAAGAFSWYRSPLLWALAASLAIATLACTLQRWRPNWRAALRQPTLIPEPLLDAAPHKAVVQPDIVSDQAMGRVDLFALARVQLQQRGFRVRCERVSSPVCCRGDRNPLSSLGTLLDHSAALLLLVGVVLSSAAGWRETLTLAPGQTGEVGHGTGLALRNDAFQIDRYPDGSPAAYTARVTIGNATETMQNVVAVNRPLVHRGLRVYLQAYRGGEPSYDVTLLVVRDPGYLPVVAAGLLFLAGLTVSLYFPRSTIHIRLVSDGSLRIAGWADHRAYEFEHEFAELAAQLSRAGGDERGSQAQTDQSARQADSGQ